MRPPAASRGFVGRAEQLGCFERALRDALDGAPRVLVVSGEAGVGKSRLVEQWLAMAAAGDVPSLVGHCVQLEHASFPYAPVVEAVRQLVRRRGAAEVERLLGGGAGALVGLVPELGPAGAAAAVDVWGQGQLFEAVLGLLVRLGAGRADDRGVVAVIEDVHWADRATLELLNYVVRNLGAAPVVIVLTRRDELTRQHPLRSWTAELMRVPGVERVDLAPFGRTDTADLLAQRAGRAQPTSLVEEIYRRSDGNAFLIEELFDAAGRGNGSLPPTLRETVLGRVGVLAPATQDVLGAVAVAGGRASHALLAAISVVDEPTLRVALGEAVDHAVLVPDGDGYAFRHAAFAEAVYDDLLIGDRRRLHAAFGTAIEREPRLVGAGEAAHRAAHWQAAGVADRAASAAVEAAVVAEDQHAPADALAQWDVALELDAQGAGVVDPTGMDRAELLARAAEAANRAGRTDRAVELVTAALALVDGSTEPHRAGHLEERRGWYHTRRGEDAEALLAYEAALALVPAVPPSAERARALTAMGRLLSRQGKATDARVWCAEAVACATAAGSVPDEGYARHALGLALAADGDVDRGFEELLAAARIAETTGDLAELAWTCMHLEKVATDARRLDDAIAVLLERASHARSRGLERTYGGLLECIAAGAMLEVGRWAEADAITAAVDARGAAGLEVVALHVVRGHLDVGRGRFASAEEHLRAAQGVALGLRDGRISGLVYTGLAELALWQGRIDAAAATVAEGLEAVANTGDDDMTARLCVAGLRTEATRAERGGRPTGAAPAIAVNGYLDRLHAIGAAAGGNQTSVGIESAAIVGSAEGHRATGDNAPDPWEAAVAACVRLRNPYEEARTRWRLGTALAAVGRRPDAERELRAALALATDLGAEPLIHQIEQVARNAQIPLRSDEVNRSAARTQGSLTGREEDVLRLVVAGRTNRQIATALFISEKTASVHVSRILAKLGVATRGEAAAVAHRQGFAT